MPSNAINHFKVLMDNVDQLVEIHGRLQAGKGRRHRQDSLHRAGVVMSVAAWEAFTEAIVQEAADAIAPGPGAPLHAVAMHQYIKIASKQAARKINTPNSQNVRRLFQDALDYDPWRDWSWSSPRRQWTSKEVRDRLDEWLRIRHCVAHGASLPGDIPWLKHNGGVPRLVLYDLKDCRQFFAEIAAQTDRGVSRHIAGAYKITPPW